MKLDLGCGPNPREGFEGVDRKFFGKNKYCDLTVTPWCVMDFAMEEKTNTPPPPPFGSVYREQLKSGPDAGKWVWAVAGGSPLKDNSVEEANCSHFVEHLTAPQRIAFVNELHRVLVPGGKCQLVVPHWASCRAYGDLTHQWPPVSEFWFYYLSKAWRELNAPHNDGYTCDFEATWGYSLHPSLLHRVGDHQNYALQFYKEAAQDIIATLTAKK